MDKLLKRTKPADVPVERPRTFRLMAAREIGLSLPQGALMQVNDLIK